MSFLTVFLPSLVLTVIIGGFLSLTFREARRPYSLAAYWGTAFLIHCAWLAEPYAGFLAPLARWLAILWIGSMLSALMLLIPVTLFIPFTRRRSRKTGPPYLLIIYVGCFLSAGLILSVPSTAGFVVREESVALDGLAPELIGYRIANLGDVHIGRFIDTQELERGIDALNKRHVSLVVVTGDLVDDVAQLEPTLHTLEHSNAPDKIIAILGNHEEMGDLPAILAAYRRHAAGIQLLVNESTYIQHGGAKLNVVGVDCPMNPKGGHMLPHPEQDAAMSTRAATAFAGVPPREMALALSHHPAFFPFAAAHGAQLTLASHTHGAQLRLFGHPIIDAYVYLQGPYRRGSAHLDVSAGFGHWLPIRFGVPREIVIVTLTRAAEVR